MLSPDNNALIDWVCPVNWLHPLNRGLVGWYVAIPGAMGGGTWPDLCRRANGVLTGMDPVTDWFWTPRPGGWGALDFEGSLSDDQVIVPSTFGLGAGPLTMMCWAYLAGTSIDGAFVKLGGISPNQGFAVGVGSTTMDAVGNNLIGLYEGVAWKASGVAIGTGWHHVAFRVNSSGSSTSSLFLDGANASNHTASTGLAPASDVTYIGGYTSGTPTERLPECRIDDVRIHNVALSNAEIAYLYRESRAGYPNLLRRVAWDDEAEAPAAGGGFIPYPRPRGLVGGMLNMSGGMQS